MTTGDKSERFNRDVLVEELTLAGAVFKGRECRCPFHEDHRASAGVYEDKSGVWRFKCHSCDVSGDVFDIRARVRNVAVKDVLPKGDAPRPLPATPPTPTRQYESLDAIARDAKGRVEATYRYSDAFAVIRVIGADGRKTFSQCHREGTTWIWGAPPKPWPLYNRESIGETEEPVIVVEGEKCVEALRDIGIVAVTSPCGAGKAKCADWTPLTGHDTVLWPDNDDPGRAHMVDVAGILAKLTEHVRVIDPCRLGLQPKGDVADLLESHGAESIEVKRAAILEIVHNAQPVNPSGRLVDLIENTIAGRRVAVPLPWAWLSKLARPLLPATVTLVCGSPGAGKSFMLLESGYHLHRSGVAVAMFCLEETRADALLRLLAQLAEDARLLDPEWVKANPEVSRVRLAVHQSDLDSFAACIHDAPDVQPTLEYLADWTRDRAAEGVRVVIIDPISVADMGSEPWNTSTKFMVSATRAIRGSGASLVLAVHPRKGAAINGLVDLDSVAGGAAFTRQAQSVFWLERHADDHKSTIGGMTGRFEVTANRTVHILKARNAPGQGTRLAFGFDGDTLRFHEKGLIEGKHHG